MGVSSMFETMMQQMDAEIAAGPKPRPVPYGWRKKPYDPAAVRADSNLLAQELRDHGVQFRSQSSIRCPWHSHLPSDSPTAEIRLQNGVYRHVCNAAGCGARLDFFEVRARFQNKTVEQVMEEYRKEKDAPTASSAAQHDHTQKQRREPESGSKSEVVFPEHLCP